MIPEMVYKVPVDTALGQGQGRGQGVGRGWGPARCPNLLGLVRSHHGTHRGQARGQALGLL